jgi:hypothetical protein
LIHNQYFSRMKRSLICFASIVVVFTLASWGKVGHKTVATIAYNHLTPQAKEVVKRFLGDTSMADVASWADEVLKQPQYKKTAPQHYANVPLGLSYEQFEKEITTQNKDNVYKAIERNKQVFTAVASTKEQRANALKFLIHFVGDLHQPMHISRAEDKGGNTIQLQYEGKGTNMHSLWDSKLIGTEGKSFEQMTIDYDKATAKQIKQWQQDPLIKWLWESYQISSKLYPEIEANNKLDESYYKSHISIVNQRVEMAGIRLAGLLNVLCKSLEYKSDVYEYGTIKKVDKPVVALNTQAPPVVKQLPGSEAYQGVKLEDVSKHIGQRVRVQGFIFDHKEFTNLILVNMGAAYPNNPLTLVFKGQAKLIAKRLIALKENKILVTGTLAEYNGKPQLEITDAKQIFKAP